MSHGSEFALFLHIVGVFGIAGATSVLLVCLAMMGRVTSASQLRPWTLVASMAERAFLGSSIMLILSGGYLVQDASYLSWGDGWIAVSALTLVVAGVIAPHLISGKIEAIHDAAEDAPDGRMPQRLAAQVKDPVLHGMAHALTTALLANAWNMVTRPGVAESLVAVVIAVVVGAGPAALRLRRGNQAGSSQ